jgi:steroid delta-isomerase-like uncharacterized protein
VGDNRDRMLRAVAAFNAGDVDGYLASYADDARVHGLPAAYPPTKDGLRAFLIHVRAGVPDLRVTVADTVAEGDRVAARLTYTGTHRGALFGAAPTGRQLEWDGITIRRFDASGRTVERWIRNDTVSLLAQLGVAASRRPPG